MQVSCLCLHTKNLSGSIGIEYEALGASKVVLDDGRLSGRITKDGSFVMYIIP